MSEEEPWHPRWLGNPLYALALALFFQYGVALHDLELETLGRGQAERPRRELLGGIWRKVRGQTLKDYVLFPLLSGPQAPLVAAGNATANLTRNVWAFAIIFCGHFPEGTVEFDEQETAEETRGEWYLRQMLGLGQPHGRAAVPHPLGQPQPPDRAPPVPRHPGPPLRRRSHAR